MKFLFDVLFLIYAVAVLPFLVLKGKWHDGFKVRFGRLPKDLKARFRSGKNIWIHAVSVGEVVAVEGLLKHLRALYPGYQFVLSVTTKTGHSLARRKYHDAALVIWSPLDLSFAVRAFVQAIRPKIYIAAETELWPNLFSCLYENNIPIAIVNGRISDKAFPKYKVVRRFLRPMLKKVSMFCMQSDVDVQRICALGAPQEKVCNVGNVKFDNINELDTADRGELGLEDGHQLWVAGSTHPGEEEMVLNIFEGVRKAFPLLRLVIAPRHPERSAEVAALVNKAGFVPVLFSKYQRTMFTSKQVLIMDTIGHLLQVYSMATVVFVGKSLTVKGGHNIIEPASFGKPVIVGPHMQNFKDMTRVFLEHQAVVQVSGPIALKNEVVRLLSSPDDRAALGSAAYSVIQQQRGATERTITILKGYISV